MLDSSKTAAVDRHYHWIPVDEHTPRGVKLQLINRKSGVAHMGLYFKSESYYTHWAPLPTFNKEVECETNVDNL